MPLQRSDLLQAFGSGIASILLLLLGVVACEDPGDPRTPAAVEPLTQSPIAAQAGASVDLAVRVTDGAGDPLPGIAVAWSVVSGGGMISGGASGSDGRAEAVWVLGPEGGEQRAQAAVDGAGSALFTADVEALPAPIITAITPDLLRPGITATLTGSGFSANPADNGVTVAGAAAAVTAATPTQLTIAVPPGNQLGCQPTGPVPIAVTVAGETGTRNHPLEVAIQRSLAAGESLIILDAAEVRCNELANGGGRYLISVFNTSTTLSSTSAFRLRGASAATAAQGPVLAAVAAATAAQAPPASRPRLPAGGPPIHFVQDLRQQAAGHEHVLAANLDLLRRIGPRAAARGGAGAGANLRIAASAAAAVPAPNVGDTLRFRVPDLDASNQCSNYIEVLGRVVYSGTRAVVLEDRNAPLAGRMDSLFVKLGEEYDGVMHGIITQHFGDPLKIDATTDDNGRLFMLFTRAVNDFTESNAFAFVFSGDLFPRSVCDQSNLAEIFYGSVPTVLSNEPFNFNVNSHAWYRLTRGVLMHEVKHLASFAERISRNATQYEETWLEEGMARLAEELLMRSLFGFGWKGNTTFDEGMRCVIQVNNDPACAGMPYGMWPAFVDLGDYLEQNETRTPLGRPEGTNDASFYGSSWALVRWAADQYAADEAAFLRALTQERSLAGVSNLAARTGRTFAELLADYVLALATDDRPGFSPARAELRVPSWDLWDMFAELNASQPQAFPRPQPLAPRNVSFGNFSVSVSALRAGTASMFELSGTQAAPQLVEVSSAGGGAPPATLRLHIVRVQ